MLETDTRELTVSVENEPVPVPGTALLIEDTVMVDRTRPLATILDAVNVEVLRVEPTSVETVMVEPVSVDRTMPFVASVEPNSVETVMVLPSMVEYTIVEAFMVDPTVMVLVVKVAAFSATSCEDRDAK
jgi:hypothetical protein